MVASLFVGAVLCAAAEPEPPRPAPALESRRDALARYGAAVWNARRDRLLTAAGMLEAASKADPDATEPLKELARLYAQLGRDLDAVRAAQKALLRAPDDYDSALLLARLLSDLGEWANAVVAAKLGLASKTLADAPPDKAVRTYRELASICEKANDLASAEAALTKAVELLTDKRAAVVKVAAFTPKEADAEAADASERLGKVRVKRGKYDAAAEAFESAARLYVKVGDTAGAARLSWNLSGALEAADKPDAALKYLEAFLKFRPLAAEPYKRLVRLLRAANREGDIEDELRKLRAADKGNDPLAAVLASELVRTAANRVEGDKLFERLTASTTDAAVIAVVVRSHLDTHRAVEIIKDLDRSFTVLKDDPNAPKMPETEALTKSKLFAGEKARAYAEALAREPDGPAALLQAAGEDLRAGNKRTYGTYFFLGATAARHHKLELAILQFRQAVRLAPQGQHWDAYTSLFQVLRSANRPGEIETVCLNALANGELGGHELLFNFHLALALAEQGKPEALAVADKLVGQGGDLNRLTVCVRRQLVLATMSKWDDAIEYGKKLLEEYDAPADRTRVRHELATAYFGAKKYAEGEAVLRAILDDDPDDTRACNTLGYHFAEQGRNLDEAERLIRHALAVDAIDRRKSGSADADHAGYRDSLGWVLFRRGKLPEARAELEKAVALSAGASDPTVWDHLGDVLFRLNEKARAKTAWEKAKELYEADPRVSSRGRRDGRLDEVRLKLKRVP
jgi:tetratricopeptide (TPR) repeat protein